ncbi:TPA: hypothetical protein QCU60_000056 [Bacillus cereus]|nr:hypothetical protein [Bacillus cereus]
MKKVLIQDQSAGHSKGGQGPHIKVRPAHKLRTWEFEGTQEHYPYLEVAGESFHHCNKTLFLYYNFYT